MSMKRLGPRSIEYTEKMNGKAIYRGTLTVSAAGKTLTAGGSPIAVHEPTTAVFDRR
jgi:phage gp29-like protein